MTQRRQRTHSRTEAATGGAQRPRGEPATDSTSDRVGRFTLIRILGSGGFATVHLAEDSALRRPVALKMLHQHLAGDEQTVRRFQAEARAAARLRHPNIVDVYEVGESADGRPYLVTELLSGSPLSRVIADSRPLSPDRVAAIVVQLASALEYMHTQGVVHRDVKPSNVMLGEDGHVTLMDFGSARELTPETRRTLTGELLGTLSYMAPEQIAGGAITPATDVYALGLLAYELLTGEPPFSGTPARVMHDQVYTQPVPLRERNAAVPDSMERAVTAALAKAPRARPPSAMAFANRFTAPPRPPVRGSPAIGPSRPAVPVLEPRDAAMAETTALEPSGYARRFPNPRYGARSPRRTATLAVSGVTALLAGTFVLSLLGVSHLMAGGKAMAGGKVPPLYRVAAPAQTADSAQTAPTATLSLTAAPVATAAIAQPTVTVQSTPAPAQITEALLAPTAAAVRATPTQPVTAASTPPAEVEPARFSSVVSAGPGSAAASPGGATAATDHSGNCAGAIGGRWQFTDVVRYGNGAGQQYTFDVLLFQQGNQVTGSGSLTLTGRLDGCLLHASFGEPGGDGAFVWSFAPDGSGFTGTFSAPGYGNGGTSSGRRLGST